MCTQLQKVEVAGAKAVTDEALQLLGCACPCLRQLTLKVRGKLACVGGMLVASVHACHEEQIKAIHA